MKLRSKKDRLRNYLKAKYGMKFENGGATGGEGGEDTDALIAALKRATSEPPAEERPSRMGGAEILSGDPLRGDLLSVQLPSETTQAGAGMAPVGYGERYSDAGEGEPRREVVEEDVPERPEDMNPIRPLGIKPFDTPERDIQIRRKQEETPTGERLIMYEPMRGRDYSYDRIMRVGARDNVDQSWSMVQDPFTLESIAYDLGEQRKKAGSFRAYADKVQKENGWDDQETNLRFALKHKGVKDWDKMSSDQVYDAADDGATLDLTRFMEGRATGNYAPVRTINRGAYTPGYSPENVKGGINQDFVKGMSGMKLLKRGR